MNEEQDLLTDNQDALERLFHTVLAQGVETMVLRARVAQLEHLVMGDNEDSFKAIAIKAKEMTEFALEVVDANDWVYAAERDNIVDRLRYLTEEMGKFVDARPWASPPHPEQPAESLVQRLHER